MKNKILVIICTFVLCFSLLVIPSFAFESGDLYGEYTFANSLDFANVSIPNDLYVDFYVRFDCNGVDYEKMSIVRNVNDNSYTLNYWVDSNNSILVYDTISGWEDDFYRFIYITEYSDSDTINIIDFLFTNEFTPKYNGWYYDIYDIIKTALFDDYEINSAQDMAITLVALLLSVGAILLPVFLILRIGKTLLMSRYM